MSNEPDYRRVMNNLRARIRAGDLRPNDRLPTYRKLAEEYEVGVTTVQIALRMLRELGWVEGRQGKGTFVAADPPVDVADEG